MTETSGSGTAWTGRRVLVTGGAGFLGSALCLELASRGAEVVALDSFMEGGGANAQNLAGSTVALVRADLRRDRLEPHLEGRDVVFNLAAQTGHMRSQRRPLEDLEINALAQLRLIEAVRAAAPGALVVHASTLHIFIVPDAALRIARLTNIVWDV